MFGKKKLKGVFASLAGTYFRLFKKAKLENALTIFIYHNVTNTPSELSKIYKLNVPPDMFDFQLRYIKKIFNVITPAQLIDGDIPPRAAMITFDDGLKDFFSNAAGIIEKNKVPAVIFLNTGHVAGDIFYSGLIAYLCAKDKGFKEYLLTALGKENIKSPLYLNCTRELVNSYIKQSGKDFKDDVERFAGIFASEDDLRKTSESPYIYYGNHLYNHDIALTLPDEELKASYIKNMEKLQSFKNFTPLFAFPFGQPGTTFSEKQVDLLLSLGARKVLSSYALVNYAPSDNYLHRIMLTDFNNTRSKIWYEIFYMEILEGNYIFESIRKAFQRRKPDKG